MPECDKDDLLALREQQRIKDKCPRDPMSKCNSEDASRCCGGGPNIDCDCACHLGVRPSKPSLLRCPFCGADVPDISAKTLEPAFSYVHCERCGAQGPCTSDEPHAEIAWNVRPAVETVAVGGWRDVIVDNAPANVSVLTLRGGDLIAIAHWGRHGQMTGWWTNVERGEGIFKVTHWMRLPPLPSLETRAVHQMTEPEREAMQRALERSQTVIDDGSENGSDAP